MYFQQILNASNAHLQWYSCTSLWSSGFCIYLFIISPFLVKRLFFRSGRGRGKMMMAMLGRWRAVSVMEDRMEGSSFGLSIRISLTKTRVKSASWWVECGMEVQMRKGNTNALDQPDLSEIYTISYALSKKLPIYHRTDKSNNELAWNGLLSTLTRGCRFEIRLRKVRKS